MFPKDPPIINEPLLEAMRLVITWCEWPHTCSRRGRMDCAHIRAKGLGGGRRKDTLENIAMLCREHHDEFDHRMGQSRQNQYWLREHVIRTRPMWATDQVLAMLAA